MLLINRGIVEMKKKFIIKNLVESHEIQASYDIKEYYDAVVKCRAYLESWLNEYIFVILYPDKAETTKENRQFVRKRFDDMYYQIQWLLENNYFSKNDFDNLNKIRSFSDTVFRKGDVFKVCNLNELDKYIDISVYYCDKLKRLTREIIDQVSLSSG